MARFGKLPVARFDIMARFDIFISVTILIGVQNVTCLHPSVTLTVPIHPPINVTTHAWSPMDHVIDKLIHQSSKPNFRMIAMTHHLKRVHQMVILVSNGILLIFLEIFRTHIWTNQKMLRSQLFRHWRPLKRHSSFWSILVNQKLITSNIWLDVKHHRPRKLKILINHL